MRTLAEGLLLLALDDDEGTVSWQRSDAVKYGLGGAILMDLELQERVDVVDKQVVVTDPSPTGDEVLDGALETIGASNKPHDARHWVKELSEKKGLREQLAHRLVARGVLREEEHAFLWVFHDQPFPTSDSGPESDLRSRIRGVVLAGAEPETRTLLLSSLVIACDLTDSLFPRRERKRAQRRIKNLVEGEQFGKAVGGAIAEAAAVVASIAATTTVVTSGSSN